MPDVTPTANNRARPLTTATPRARLIADYITGSFGAEMMIAGELDVAAVSASGDRVEVAFKDGGGAVITIADSVPSYRVRIAALLPDHNARHIEAWMRSEWPTLDHLSAAQFKLAAELAASCAEAAGFQQSERLAQSLGL